MGIPRLFKLPDYNKYSYHPRFYDPKREALEKRKSLIEHELELERKGRKIEFKTEFNREGYFYKRSKVQRTSSIRVAVIMAALILIAYLLFYWI